MEQANSNLSARNGSDKDPDLLERGISFEIPCFLACCKAT